MCTGARCVSFIGEYFHKNVYELVRMGKLAHTFVRIKSTNMLPMYLQSGVPIHWRFNTVVLNTKTRFSSFFFFFFFGGGGVAFRMFISTMPPKSCGNMQKHGCLWCFHGSDRQWKYIRVSSYSVSDNPLISGLGRSPLAPQIAAHPNIMIMS